MSEEWSEEKNKAAIWIIVGVVLAAAGAAAIWGIGGPVLVFGIFVAAMSMADYWKAT